MRRSIYLILFIYVLLGIYSGAFAEDCNVTVKCVCETQKSLRAVPCPNDFSNTAIDCTKEGIPEGTCAVDCGQEVEAVCEEIPIQCKSNEKADCVVTLPIIVGTTPGVCAPGETDCNGTCVDTNTDESNCGQCGVVCALGEICDSGACVCQASDEVCDGLDNDCDGIVDNGFDLDTDESNCGQCGTVCALGEICDSGACVCQASDEVCDGLDNDCDGIVDNGFDLDTDESNCGQCGVVCAPGDTCVNGTCNP
ncbi:MAG: hypothetical protein AB1598_12135 [Thermodesulfobacteriota bacterium]